MTPLEELLFIETDDGCANCGFRDTRALTIHHLEQVIPSNESYDNKRVLCHNCHQCHHQGKGPSAGDLRQIKRRLIIKTMTRQGLNALTEARRRGAVAAAPYLVSHLIEMGYLVCKEEISSWASDDESEKGVIEALYTITRQGTALLGKWDL